MTSNFALRVGPVVAAVALAGTVLVGCQNEAKPAAPAETPYHLRATVAEIMDSMVMPAADVIWNSTAVTESLEGTKDSTPKNDEDWKVVERAAVMLSEALNSLMIPGRHVDKPGAVPDDPESELAPDKIEEMIRKDPQVWIGFAQSIDGTVEKIQGAIKARDLQAISDLGGELDEICENCHLHFWYPKQEKK
jgi:hypothetical protein